MPTGTVTFSDRGHALASVSVDDHKAKFSTSSLDVGVHQITASYDGDGTFLPSTSPEVKQIVRAETRTELNSSHNPSETGQAVTFTAVVTPNAGGTSTGTVTFTDYSSVIATVRMSGGCAIFTTSRLRKGRHVIHADYNGTLIDRQSSAIVAQRVK